MVDEEIKAGGGKPTPLPAKHGDRDHAHYRVVDDFKPVPSHTWKHRRATASSPWRRSASIIQRAPCTLVQRLGRWRDDPAARASASTQEAAIAKLPAQLSPQVKEREEK